MARLTALAVSALALFAERPTHPYELFQLMLQRREDHVINVSAGSLYRAVERLASDGLIVSSGVERLGHRPERTVYAITDAGRHALRGTLTEMLATHVNEYPEFPVAIREVRNLPASDVALLLGDRLAAVSEAIQFANAALDRIDAKGLDRYLVLDVHYSRAMLEAEARWITDTIDELASGELSWVADEPRDGREDEASPGASTRPTELGHP